ncbi:hypothetical protein LTR56_002563 [Elasticomyces elasticus]|nr:hypothetical protein LTR22_013465 [Elasticomyces elasticus]KAK3657049.1 hypothetical protein LTR56_002563 [Elasticomyces elasticus]KAK4926722.1 hypothetical protein LTR49_006404 [Elasticomyces elasticus]KAK5762327.1 hypothetical protein LTS12_007486 [Elasticomyces elasticus]
MDSSPLARLPVELRQTMYELVLTMAWPTIFFEQTKPRCKIRYVLRTRQWEKAPHHYDPWGTLATRGHRNNLAIIRTCKQVHREAAQAVFSCNEFRLTLRTSSVPEEIRYSDLNKVAKILMARFLATIRGNSPKAIEIAYDKPFHLEHLNPDSDWDDHWSDLRALLLELRPLAARFPGCDLRVNLTMDTPELFHEGEEYGYGGANALLNCLIRVRDPVSSIETIEARVRRRTLAVQRPYLAEDDRRLHERWYMRDREEAFLDPDEVEVVCQLLGILKADYQKEMWPASEGATVSHAQVAAGTIRYVSARPPLPSVTSVATPQDASHLASINTGNYLGALTGYPVCAIASYKLQQHITLQKDRLAPLMPTPSPAIPQKSEIRSLIATKRYRSFHDTFASVDLDDEDPADDTIFAMAMASNIVNAAGTSWDGDLDDVWPDLAPVSQSKPTEGPGVPEEAFLTALAEAGHANVSVSVPLANIYRVAMVFTSLAEAQTSPTQLVFDIGNEQPSFGAGFSRLAPTTLARRRERSRTSLRWMTPWWVKLKLRGSITMWQGEVRDGVWEGVLKWKVHNGVPLTSEDNST